MQTQSLHPQHSDLTPEFHSLLGQDSIKQNTNIDQDNLSVIISSWYLRNYTYLEFCIFPELFDLFLSQLTNQELIKYFYSYIDIYSEFIPQVFAQQFWASSIVSNLAEIQNTFINNHSHQNVEINTNESHKQRDPRGINDHINKKLEIWTQKAIDMKTRVNEGNFWTELDFLIDNINFLRISQNNRVKQQRAEKSILEQLFKLLVRLLKEIFSRGVSNLLIKPLTQQQTLHCLLWQLTEYYSTMQKSHCNPNFRVYLLDSLTLPFLIEFIKYGNYLMNGNNRESYRGLSYALSQNIFLKLLKLIKALYQLNKLCHNQLQEKKSNNESINLNKMFIALQQSFKTNAFKEINEIPAEQQKKAKVLTTQIVESIAKLISRLQLNSKSCQSIKKIQKMQIEQDLMDNVDSIHSHNTFEATKSLKSQISFDFLLNYYKLSELFQNQSKLPDIQEQVFLITNSMFKNINKKLVNIFDFQEESVESLWLTLDQLEIQCNLAVQILTLRLDRYSQQIKTALESKPKREISKIAKIKNSIYINILSIKIIKETFTYQDYAFKKTQTSKKINGDSIKINKAYTQIPNNGSIDDTKMQSRTAIQQESKNEIHLTSVNDIQKLFDEVVVLFTDFSNFQLDKSFALYPALQSILIMLGAVDLWSHYLSSMIRDKKQIQIFFLNVTKLYSDQNAKIDVSQLVYVELILTYFQFVKQAQNQSQFKIIEKINKLLEFKNKPISIGYFINSERCLERILQSLAKHLILFCIPNQQQIQNNISSMNLSNQINSEDLDALNKILQRIPFWSILRLKLEEINQKNISSYLTKTIFDKSNSIQFIKTKSEPPLTIEQANNDQVSQININKFNSDFSKAQMFELFVMLKGRYSRLVDFKSKLLNKKKQPKESVASNQSCLRLNFVHHNTKMFLFEMVENMWRSTQSLKLLNSQSQHQMRYLNAKNDQFSEYFLNRLRQAYQQMSNSIDKSLLLFKNLIINQKLLIYKPSNQQLNSWISQLNLPITTRNYNKVLEKHKLLNELLNDIMKFGLLAIAYLNWSSMQIVAKIQLFYGKKTEIDKNSTFLLLRMVVFLSYMTNETTFSFNFDRIESLLESNIDLPCQQNQKNKPLQPLCFLNHKFPRLRLDNQFVRHQISSVFSYEFIEFIYEYIPFDINSYKEQMNLLNLSVDYALNQDNHQFYSMAKSQRITFNKIIRYIEKLIKKDSHQNNQNHKGSNMTKYQIFK